MFTFVVLPGYGRFGGSRVSAAELSGMFQYMEENSLLQPERLLTGNIIFVSYHHPGLSASTGYIPGGEALSSVLSLAQKLREKNPELIYLLDRKSHVGYRPPIPLTVVM